MKPPPMPEFNVPLVTPQTGTIATVWWEWLQQFVKWADDNASNDLSSAEYTYSTTAGVPPSTGQLRGNSLTQTAITALYLHKSSAPGVDVSNALKLINTGNKVLVQDKTNSANARTYTASGVAVDHGTYITVPVTYTSGGANFTAGRVIVAVFGLGS